MKKLCFVFVFALFLAGCAASLNKPETDKSMLADFYTLCIMSASMNKSRCIVPIIEKNW